MSTRYMQPLLVVSGIGLLIALLVHAGCSGQRVWTQGGWVAEGDDVIVVQAEKTTTRRQTLYHVRRTFERLEMPIDTMIQPSGYVRTAPVPINDTLDARLTVVVPDTSAVEVAGEFTNLNARERTWERVAWNKSLPRSTGVWSFMTDVATAIGRIEQYEEDPRAYGTACGGRRCGREESCQNNVCVKEKQQPVAGFDSEPCISAEEEALLSQIRSHRRERGLSEIPISARLTRVARAHARDLADNAPHEGTLFGKSQCTLHSWSTDGPWSPCCYTPDRTNAACMREKPEEITGYPASGHEIVADSVRTAREAFRSWMASEKSTALLANRGDWRGTEWRAIGVGIYKGYAVAWLGTEKDAARTPFRCGGQRPSRN